jgi:hypothetical protein
LLNPLPSALSPFFCDPQLYVIDPKAPSSMALIEILETSVVLLSLWTVAEVIRRLYFHPLAAIPGPRLAASTWWYEFYFDVIKPGQYILKIQELHKKYGMPS